MPFASPSGLLVAGIAACLLAGCNPPPPVAAPAVKPASADHGHDHGHSHDHDHGKPDHDHPATPAPAATAQPAEKDHDHDDHEHPLTLAAGIGEFEKLAAGLGEKLADDAGEAADDAVHAIAHVLEDLRGLVRKELAEGEAAKAATTALDELEECFSKVDEAFHTADDKADPPAKVLDTVKDRVEAAIKALKEAVR
jgi:hypothetical protein